MKLSKKQNYQKLKQRKKNNMNGKQMRFSNEELGQIKALYGNNENALKLLRKVFLPELLPDAPIGQNIDLWMTFKVEDLNPEDALINLKARNTLISHLEQCLLQLSLLAGQKDESVEDTLSRLKKDSTK